MGRVTDIRELKLIGCRPPTVLKLRRLVTDMYGE